MSEIEEIRLLDYQHGVLPGGSLALVHDLKSASQSII